MKRIGIVVAVVVLAVLGLAVWSNRTAPIPDDLPHVVMVVLCSTRADQTPMYGLPYDTMPKLSERAASGVVFEDGVTAAPWTRPGVTAALTGAHPATLGMLEPRDIRSDRVLPASARPIAERLDDVGYVTVGRSANPNVSATFGFDQGFDDFQNLSPEWRGGVEKVRGTDVVVSLLQAIDEQEVGESRLFAQAVFVDAHQPMSAARSAGQRWRDDGVPLRVGRYRAMLRTLDAAVDQLVVGLDERGFDTSNTVFVVVNDHGEGMRFPRHNGKGHGRYLYPSTTKLVWTMFGRGVAAGRYPGLVSQVDVVPTLLDFVGLPISDVPDGRSFSGVLDGEFDAPGRTHAYSATMFSNTERAAAYTPTARCLLDFGDGRAQRLESLRNKPVFEPFCSTRTGRPVSPEVEAELRQDLSRWWAEMMDRLADQGAQGITAANGEVPPDIEAMLQALGYTDDAQGVPTP